MSSNLSTEATGPASSSGNVGTGTVGELKTDFANLLINRVTLGECLNVIRDACVARAGDIVDEADEPTLENIKKDVAAFREAGSAGEAGSSVGDGTVATGPAPDATGPSDSSGPTPDATGPSDSSGPTPDASGPAENGGSGSSSTSGTSGTSGSSGTNVGGPTGP